MSDLVEDLLRRLELAEAEARYWKTRAVVADGRLRVLEGRSV